MLVARIAKRVILSALGCAFLVLALLAITEPPWIDPGAPALSPGSTAAVQTGLLLAFSLAAAFCWVGAWSSARPERGPTP